MKSKIQDQMAMQPLTLAVQSLTGQIETRIASYCNSNLDTSQHFDHNFRYRSPNKVIQLAIEILLRARH